jgi:lysophospholipase L1-like esterase
MSSIFAGLAAIPASLIALELGARLYHLKKFKVPFQGRSFAEYPYDQFVEQALPPFFFRLRKGYRSRHVNINQAGLRGPELSSKPETKRALFLGESILFGVKLKSEEDLWSSHLKRLLDQRADSAWEILNFSFPGYNTFQYRAFYEQELRFLNPDLLILSIGGNDITQARMFGEKWSPGFTYPFDFILALARKSQWWEKILNESCFYHLWRRKHQEAKRKAFLKPQATFHKEKCFQAAMSNVEAIVKDAQASGIKVVFLNYFPVYEPSMSLENKIKIASIQSNWNQYAQLDGPPIFEYMDRIQSELAPRLNMPVLELRQDFWNHPDRFTLYYDLYHLNQKGMRILARLLYEKIALLGYWKMGDGGRDRR